MDQGRIERALRDGPPGEGGYVSRSLDLDDGGSRPRSVSTRAPLPAGLALAVVAILVGLAAFGRGLVPGSEPSVFGGAVASATPQATLPSATAAIPPATPVTPSGTPAGAGVRACEVGDLHAAVTRWSASVLGTIQVTNTSGSPCQLQGRPGLQLLDGLGFPIGSGPSAQSAPSVAPDDPVAVLPHGGTATVVAAWTSWCGPEAPKGPLAFRLVLPSAAGSLLADPDWAATRQPDPPACAAGAPSGPAVHALGPFQADQGSN